MLYGARRFIRREGQDQAGKVILLHCELLFFMLLGDSLYQTGMLPVEELWIIQTGWEGKCITIRLPTLLPGGARRFIWQEVLSYGV